MTGKFKKGDWVESARVGSKGKFVGEVIGTSQGEYVIRDADRVKWLRKEDELSPAKPKAANDNERADQRARMQHWRL